MAMHRQEKEDFTWDKTIEAIEQSLHKVMAEKSTSNNSGKNKTTNISNKMPEKSDGSQLQKPVAPDGGWGWVVVFGVALANMTTQSLVSTFGLLFGDALKEMGQETTGAALIMNVMSATTNLSGLITGPVIKRFSYRKVAIVGGILFSTGIFFASLATTMTHLLFSYSLLSGLGLGLTGPASFVALSTYFSSRRGRAVGLALVGTGLGQMLMPQAVRALLDYYGFQGAMLLIGAVSLHAIFGASLYQPIARHYKYPDNLTVVVPNSIESPPKPDVTTALMKPISPPQLIIKTSFEDGNENSEEIIIEKSNEDIIKTDCVNIDITPKTVEESNVTTTLLNLPSNESAEYRTLRRLSNAEMGSNLELDVYAAELLEAEYEASIKKANNENNKTETSSKKRRRKIKGLISSCWGYIVEVMDLNLFLDPVFVNIVIGLAIFNVSNINFSMIFPFFVLSLGYTRSDAALCMSVTAGADIIARLLVPSVTDRVKSMGSRNTLLVAMVLLAATRSLLAQQTDLNALIAVSVLCGLVRGAAILNLNLSIAEYCCNEKLPAALGINMVLKGIAILSLGPFLGWLRDASGSFPLCVHAQSLLLLLTAISWGIEMFVSWRRRNRAAKLTLNVVEQNTAVVNNTTTS